MTLPIDPGTYSAWMRVEPGRLVDLANLETRDGRGPEGEALSKKAGKALTKRNVHILDELQRRLFAERRRSVLVVLQAMDAGGKDGCIRRVFGPLNPQGVRVQGFRAPTFEQAQHDFLWRVHAHAPARGYIHVFNRSHYEDVLAARVLGHVPPEVWTRRFAHIRNFEQLLSDEGTLVLKFFLHISKDEQKARLQRRLADPARRWKLSHEDLTARQAWRAYQVAYEEVFQQTSRPHAPWYVIPADRKWFRDVAVSTILKTTLEAQGLHWPEPREDLSDLDFA